MRSFEPPSSPALVEMLRQSGELDRILDGQGLVFDNPPNPTVQPPAAFIIPAPDWEAERRQRDAAEREHDRQQRATILAEELARLETDQPPPQPTPPAARRKRLRILTGDDEARP